MPQTPLFMRFLTAISLVAALLLLSIGQASAANKVRFEAQAQLRATVGKTLKVSFTLNANPDNGSFKAPSFEGFDVIAGPTTSSGSSTTIINGKTTSSVSHTTTYVVVPQEAGTFVIGAAKIASGGKSYSTKPLQIEVSDVGDNRNPKQSAEERANSRIGKEDLILRWALSSKSLYKGEPLCATLKLYSRVNIAGADNWKFPSFDGFWKQELKTDQARSREEYNGMVYDVYNVANYLLYPQQCGTLTIDPAEVRIVSQVQVESDEPDNTDPFAPFFGFSGFDVYNVERQLRTSPIKVEVRELPAGAPESFAGAVGDFEVEQNISSQKVTANSSATLTIRINGRGNLNFIQAPKPVLPNTFELYEVKSSESVRNTASGSSGYRQFEYPFIVRSEGDYTIPSTEFSYFSTSQGRYITISTDPIEMTVLPDNNQTSNALGTMASARAEEVRHLAEDIRFIKLDDPKLRSNIAPLVLSPLYFALLAAMILVAALVYILVGRYRRNRSDVVLVRGRRANKVAVRRFRTAAKYMHEKDRRAFYQEMLLALWGYLGDRFNIPVADLTKSAIREELSRRGNEAAAERIIDIITRCEEAQYSPIVSASMDDVYSEGIEIISQIESAIKR